MVFGGEEEQQGSESAKWRKSSYRAVLEKKLSIAERAVATNHSCVALQLERLRICQELLEPSLLAKEWKKLVSVHMFLCFHETHAMLPSFDSSGGLFFCSKKSGTWLSSTCSMWFILFLSCLRRITLVISVVSQVFLHPNSAPLWREYLLFTQSYFSNFTVSKVNSAYGKCLSTLSAVRDGSMVSHPALPGLEEDMLGNRDLF